MNILKETLKRILYVLSHKKSIIFESCPDLSDNSKAVFDEMIKRGLNKKYNLVWLLFDNNKDKYPKVRNVRYIQKGNKIFSWYSTLAKCFICCNRFFVQNNSYQKSYFLTHGMYVKKPTSYYTMPEKIDYCFSSSEELKEIQANALNVPMDKMVCLGYPRNDILTQKPIDLHGVFKEEFSKIIVWYPTFRQHNLGMGTGSTHSVPIIWDEENAIQLNNAARDSDVLVVMKPHFAQDTSKIKALNLENIKFIDDNFFINNKITSYEFIAACDALITDYSSVYFDYTLCDKPIGLVWEDYDEYEKKPGFALDMNYYMKGGVKIYNLADFQHFLKDVSLGNDTLQEERREIAKISNYSTDGKSSERVVDFIISTAKL